MSFSFLFACIAFATLINFNYSLSDKDNHGRRILPPAHYNYQWESINATITNDPDSGFINTTYNKYITACSQPEPS